MQATMLLRQTMPVPMLKTTREKQTQKQQKTTRYLYGDDKDELLAKEGWFPTFVKPSSTNDQISGEIAE